MEYTTAVKMLRKDRDTPEARGMFCQMLTAMFEEYHIKGQGGGTHGPHYWRRRALDALEHTEGDHPPARAVFFASDTGVPNERLIAAYTLIFG